jgi:hypothetical protein
MLPSHRHREVAVHMWTHAAGGITMYDFVMAAKLDRLDVEYSPKWLTAAQERMRLKVTSSST